MPITRIASPAKLPPTQESVAQILRDLVHERTGIFFDESRLPTMLEKIDPRVKATASPSYLDYYYLLKYDERGVEEWRNVLEAFSVQETYFWREVDQIRALVDEVVPQWFAKNAGPLRIWSAACATGEEPYSLAIALGEAGWSSHPIEIYASDASENALGKARAALYRERSFRSLPEALRERYFTKSGDAWALKSEIRSRVKFQWANLMGLAPAADLTGFPVIFCRNVFIYFSVQTMGRVVAEFAERMPPDGYLFIGASESLLKITDQFELQEVGDAFAYRRKAGV